jgi:hypothetical protein
MIQKHRTTQLYRNTEHNYTETQNNTIIWSSALIVLAASMISTICRLYSKLPPDDE